MATPEVVHLRDTRANQPAAAVGNAGVLFCVTDEGNIIERSNGTTWEAYSPASVDETSVSITGGSITNLSTLEIPVSATPTVDEDGEIALDTTVADFSHGIVKVFGGEELGLVAMPIAEFTTPSDGYVVAYNATNDEFELVAQSGGGGGSGAFEYQWAPAGAITPSVTSGCQSLTTIASASGQPDIQTLNFDATTQEYGQFSLAPPAGWGGGTVTFAPVWSHASTTTNFGVVWDLQAVAVSNDDTILANFGTAQTSTDTGGTTDDIYIGPTSAAITIAGTPTDGDMVFFRISRVTGDGSDTMAVDARLHGVRVFFS